MAKTAYSWCAVLNTVDQWAHSSGVKRTTLHLPCGDPHFEIISSFGQCDLFIITHMHTCKITYTPHSLVLQTLFIIRHAPRIRCCIWKKCLFQSRRVPFRVSGSHSAPPVRLEPSVRFFIEVSPRGLILYFLAPFVFFFYHSCKKCCFIIYRMCRLCRVFPSAKK